MLIWGFSSVKKKISLAAIKPNNAICSTTKSCRVFQNSCPETPPVILFLCFQNYLVKILFKLITCFSVNENQKFCLQWWQCQGFCQLLLEVSPVLSNPQPLMGLGAAHTPLLAAFSCALGNGRLGHGPQEFLIPICSCTHRWHLTCLQGLSVFAYWVWGLLGLDFQVFNPYDYCWKLISQQLIYLWNCYSHNDWP